MRILALVVAVIAATVHPASAQVIDPPDGTRIASAQVSGLDLDKLSPGLQEEIAKLAGSPLNREDLKAIAARIELEQPRFVAAPRVDADPAGLARVVFVAARLRDPEYQANINAKYIVEVADVRGVPKSALSPELRADLQAMTGQTLDSDLAERLELRLKSAFPEYDVERRTLRGSQPGTINVRYQLRRAEWSRWLRFQPLQSHVTYHSDQKWGALIDVPIGGRDVRVTPIFAIDTTDDLIEEYSGYGVRFETRKLGTERLGVSLEGSWFDPKWRPSTLAALASDPGIPGAYGKRSTFTPLLSFAVTRHLTLTGGASLVELEPLESAVPSPGSSAANAVVGSLSYQQRRDRDAGGRHEFNAALTVRSGTRSLESDFIYTRSLGQAAYSFRSGRHRVLLSGMAGVIDGGAPLFERFALGDTRTLRGWDKYKIAPAGGDRMAHASVEYRFGVLAMFLDSGSVWNDGTTRKLRVSTGLGFYAGPFFMTAGVPLNTGERRATFAIGLRFGGVGVQR
jgi:hypothetical protein